MKVLRNPWVTAVLVLVAFGVVAYQVWQPHWTSGPALEAKPSSPAPAPAVAVAPAPAPQPQTPPPAPALPPGPAIESHYPESHMVEWADSPQRDPFRLVLVAGPKKPAHQYPSPLLTWKLKAVWRQTGSRLAAINNRVYAEGDRIEGYKIERIEADQVWFQGPDGLVPLAFDKTASKPKANRK